MATNVMTQTQTMISNVLPQYSGPSKLAGGVSSSLVCSSGLRSVPSTTLGRIVNKRTVPSQESNPNSASRLVVSVLEEPRVLVSSTDCNGTTLNPTEVLLKKFASMPPPNDTVISYMSEAADRLFSWDEVPKLAEKQTFTVYELNEFDRDSPAFLELSRQSVNKIDPETGAHIHALGDQVPFTNKLYDSALTTRLGITTGICLLMKSYPGRGAPELHSLPFFIPDHYETIMSWYFGDMGHISGMGPFINFQDTLMGITGGTGFFAEARGVVRLHPITPFKFMYTFTLTGIPELPKLLTKELVTPHFGVESHPDALACKPDCTLPNFTD